MECMFAFFSFMLIFGLHIFMCLNEMYMFSNFKMNRLGLGKGQNNNVIFK